VEWLMRRHSTTTGAKGIVSGTISNGATWIESIEISQNNVQILNADTSIWKFVFKHCDSGNVCLTLTSGTEITITQNTTYTLLAINVAAGSLSSMVGDYIADLSQKDGSGTITHWASGTITFINENLGY